MKTSIERIIRNWIKPAMVGVLVAVGMVQGKASLIYESINQVQTFTFALTATVQGGVSTSVFGVTTNAITVRVTTKDVIAALGKGYSTNFSGQAGLFQVTDTSGGKCIVIRDPLNPKILPRYVGFPTNTTLMVGFDVTTNFQRGIFSCVTKSTTSARGKTVGTMSSSDDFTLQAGSFLSGNLSGFTTSDIDTGALTSTVVGTGTLGKAPCLFHGVLVLSPKRTETVTAVVGPPHLP